MQIPTCNVARLLQLTSTLLHAHYCSLDLDPVSMLRWLFKMLDHDMQGSSGQQSTSDAIGASADRS